MDELICQGCGVTLQTTDKNKAGYTPASALEREIVLCQRCFRLKHYNESQEVSVSDDDFLQMVSSIRNANGLVVHLIDLFDVEGSLLKNLHRIVGNSPVVLVANKVDLLPKSINVYKLEKWLRSSAKNVGVRVKDVFLISAKKGHGVVELAQAIENERNTEDVYIVGTTNVGKSTFINRLIKHSTGEGDVITTSYFPGTTLGFIEIPLDETSVLIDTPGIVNKQQLVHYVSDKDLKIITPDKEIKPRVYQLNPEQTLFIGGLARVDFIKGERQSFVCYFANDLAIHRTKLEKAEALFEEHLGGLLSPPDAETLAILPEFKSHDYRLPEEKTDIVLPGLGWISVPSTGASVRVHIPEEATVTLRQSLL
ncbi:uncharacterized protein JNUCC1_03442 [Lentibacillus sp. JNUCC-1]|uniref:ribosome biogenesis GTPase YqeH n=1 Tax=Lentibacillus sp. JNUCC-1 TaxID=2654513 RepID=UPI0012E96C98|nr:ribosome biogenesis GTPase YqeH [Lentibacillus sp. JNUCC-1]MUV39564.1 uncharacterized protein [Lentibacillus sp. JNUCC-1]